jgi:aminodeoxyfutalosine synthase
MPERPRANFQEECRRRPILEPSDPLLSPIAEKIFSGEALSPLEAIDLFDSEDLPFLGVLSNFVREKLHGTATTFSVNRHINYSNICANDCLFCAFRRDETDNRAARLSIEDISDKIAGYGNSEPLEIHITGALDPTYGIDEAIQTIDRIRKIQPEAVIKAFTLVEVDFFSRRSGLDAGDVMQRLKDAGVSAFPGGGAEIFSPRIRSRVCPDKISGERWLKLAELAHSKGIPTNATMLYGIGESYEDRVEHLEKIRALQERTKGFMAFIPLLFQKENSKLKIVKSVTLAEQLKLYAVSRLFLHNVPHLKVHWAMSGLKAAELSQWFGVDDIEGTIVEERIGHEAGAGTPVGMTKDAIISIIERSGRVPLERDGLYNT